MRPYAVIALFASVAFGQTPVDQGVDRTFYFTQAKTTQEFQEAATAIRSITNLQQTSTDDAQKSVTFQGTADQIVLAQWLYNELDQSGSMASREYSLPGKPDDVTRIAYLTQPKTPQDFAEAATVVRSIANIPQAYLFFPHHAVVMRGNAAQIALASWLFAEFEKHASEAASQSSTAPEYRATDGRDGENIVRVFYLKNTATVQDFTEAVTLVRSISNLRQVFMYNAPRAVAVRGTADQMLLAAWLINQIDRPIKEQIAASEYTVPASKDDIVRVLYIAQAGTPQELNQIATQIRNQTKVQKLFIYSTPKAIAVRGTSEQVALAEQLSRP
jgi:hypothetical protein